MLSLEKTRMIARVFSGNGQNLCSSTQYVEKSVIYSLWNIQKKENLRIFFSVKLKKCFLFCNVLKFSFYQNLILSHLSDASKLFQLFLLFSRSFAKVYIVANILGTFLQRLCNSTLYTNVGPAIPSKKGGSILWYFILMDTLTLFTEPRLISNQFRHVQRSVLYFVNPKHFKLVCFPTRGKAGHINYLPFFLAISNYLLERQLIRGVYVVILWGTLLGTFFKFSSQQTDERIRFCEDLGAHVVLTVAHFRNIQFENGLEKIR